MKSNNNSIFILALRTLTLVTLSLSMSSPAMAKIYKWTDDSGKTHYTATPPPTKIKAKTEEFKIQKIKKSSLTYKGDEHISPSSSQNNKSSKSTKRVKRSAKSQCRNSMRKIPAMTSSLKRKLRQAKARGKVSDIEFKKAMSDLNKTKENPQTMDECLKNYKNGGTQKNDIDLVANNSAEDALSYMMLNAAFEQAAKDQLKNSKKSK